MFDRDTEEACFLSPAEDFGKDRQPIQFRRDPLTGMGCRINVKRTQRVKQAQHRDFSQLAGMAREGCFFCPENVERMTPRFPEELIPGGRLRRGESWVFPNLFPFARYHGVATVTREHHLDIKDFTRTQLADAIHNGLDFFRRVHEFDGDARYAILSWNHLPASGASIIHPHIQLTMDGRATNFTALLLERSRQYHEEHGRNYWEVLVREEERIGERFISRKGDISWLASFAPLGNSEVMAVFHGRANLFQLRDGDVEDLAAGIRNVLSAYYAMGRNSFNLTVYSAPVDQAREDYSLNLRIISRPDPTGYYTSDIGFMEALHHERVVESMPEAVAASVRDYF
ncbi:MAG: hypothetical protein GXO65_01665 [Euryarchaeota archaeon]|nr:hypothetical protein [Euryarchaeota archaeon]